MCIKLFDSERRVMECLWDLGDLCAKDIAARLNTQIGWSKTTTYIKKCIEKKALLRIDPGFMCHALISRDEILEQETDEFIERNFDGAADKLVASLLGQKKLSADEIGRLKQLIERLEADA